MKSFLNSFCLAAVVLLNAACSNAQPPKGLPDGIKPKWADVAYAAKSKSQKLDIYLPENGKGPFPVILFIHGGAFMFGDKADGQLVPAIEGLNRGYAVVSMNYRMSGEAIFPAGVQDVKAAIRFLRANAGKYNLNPDKFASFGNSAGGYFAAMAGTTGDLQAFEDASLGNPGVSTKLQAVVDLYGPIVFDQMDEQLKASGNGRADHGAANSPESKFIGSEVYSSPELVKKASPASYISKDDPPFLIQAGTKDPIVPTQQSERFAESLRKLLGEKRVKLTLLQGAGHGGPAFESKENLDVIFGFLDQYLK